MLAGRFALRFVHENQRKGGNGDLFSCRTGTNLLAIDERPLATMCNAQPARQTIVNPASMGFST